MHLADRVDDQRIVAVLEIVGAPAAHGDIKPRQHRCAGDPNGWSLECRGDGSHGTDGRRSV